MRSAVRRIRETATTLRWFFGRSKLPLAVWPAASSTDLSRFFDWYRTRPEKRFDLRTIRARVDQVVRGYSAAGLPERFRYRELIAGRLADPDDAGLPLALHLAARIAVPEARDRLVKLTTTLLKQTHDDTGRDARRITDLRPVLVRALGRLRDGSLLALFDKMARGDSEQAIAYEAARAIALLEPLGLHNGVFPGHLADDPGFLADLLEADLPDVREATLANLKRRPALQRQNLAGALPLTDEEKDWLLAD